MSCLRKYFLTLQSCKKYCKYEKEMEKCNCTSVENIGYTNARLCETKDEGKTGQFSFSLKLGYPATFVN